MELNKQDVLDALDLIYGVTDVYWHKDVLYVINDSDMPAVEDYLDVSPYLFRAESVSNDVLV